MNITEARQLAVDTAAHLPGEWVLSLTGHDANAVGAVLVSGTMQLFFSVQSGYGHKPGMVRVTAHYPRDTDITYPGTAKDSIWVGEKRTPEAFAKEITRRILDAGYPERLAEYLAAAQRYRDATTASEQLARELAEVLGTQAQGESVNAYPHGMWRANAGSAHLDVYLPRELALKVARMLRQEMALWTSLSCKRYRQGKSGGSSVLSGHGRKRKR